MFKKLVLFVVAMSALFFLVADRSLAGDAVGEVVDAYLEEAMASGVGSDSSMDAWHLALKEVARENPKSGLYNVAMSHAISILNSRRDYKASEALAEEVVDNLARNHPKRSSIIVGWYRELGEVRRLRAFAIAATGNRSDAEEISLSAVEAFEDLIQYVDTLEHDTQTDEVIGMKLVALSMASSLYANVLDKPSKAVDLARSGRGVLESLGSRSESLAVWKVGYNAENFCNLQMKVALQANDTDAAREALDAIVSVENLQMPASSYAREFAADVFSNQGDAFQDFVDDWLQAHPSDSETVALLYYSGQDYFKRGELEEAANVYKRISKDFMESLLALDKPAFSRGRGGYYGGVLAGQAKIHISNGEIEQAEKKLADLKKLLPNDPRAESVQSFLEAARHGPVSVVASRLVASAGPVASVGTLRTVILIINVVSLIVIAIGISWHRAKRVSN